MKKLLFVISQLYKGGAETSLINLLNNIDYTRYTVDLVVLNQFPVADAVSLIPYVNRNVRLCDAYEKYHKFSFIKRVRAKFLYTSEQKVAFYYPALDFVRNTMYDWAFFVGEWCSPAFVAYHTNAVNKAAWIHCDLSLTTNFDAELYFHFFEQFDYYLFVSKAALKASIQKYPFLKEKAKVIYNVNDSISIRKQAQEEIGDYTFDKEIPTILTCANIRPEKNHIRQVRVMGELKRRGIIFNWLNIGSTVDNKLVEEIKKLAKAENVDDRFILLGSRQNPYKYIKNADLISVLSDYESWSMVITEAKLLGIPVVSTKTAGALEQIENYQTGILSEFDITSIADRIEELLSNRNVLNNIRSNLKDFDNTEEIMKSFYELLDEVKPKVKNGDKILYIIDDIHYNGGAHAVTFMQIKELVRQGKKITIFSNTIPDCKKRIELNGINFITWRDVSLSFLLNKRLLACLLDNYITKIDKKLRKKIWFGSTIKKDSSTLDKILYPQLSMLFSQFDTVCVMSEASIFRKYVAESECKRKIQWIHTDYCAWRNYNDWTRSLTKDDELIYSKYDVIVLLSNNIKDKFINAYPKLASKAIVIQNILPVNKILNKSYNQKNYPKVHFITIGRLGEEKALERLLRVLIKLHDEGYQFLWEIVGDGPLRDKLEEKTRRSGLEEEVLFLGHKDNPQPYLLKSQVFALLSNYEGTPNTIYEALISGKPILATNVGGICDQLCNGKYGWLVDNNEGSIYEGIKHILENQGEIQEITERIQCYTYDYVLINNQLGGLFVK